MLVGEPGIGKTRLAQEIAAHAAARGVSSLWGRCWEAGGAPAYWPWIQILRARLGDLATALGGAKTAAAEVAGLVPEIGERIGELPALPALEPQQARFRLFDSVATALQRLTQKTPLVLVIDDLHAADIPSLLLLHFLVRALPGSRLLVLATYRDAEARLTEDVGALLSKIAREGESLRLPRLTQAEVESWIAEVRGPAASGATGAEVHRITEGNPLFVHEVLCALGEGVCSTAKLIPENVRHAIGERLSRLPEASRELLLLGSVFGRAFASSALASLAGRPLAEVEHILRDAAAAGVLGAASEVGGEYAFSHILLRDALYETLSPDRRAELHWRAGEVLEASSAESLDVVAYHLLEGATAADARKAAAIARRAAEHAMRLYAFEDAALLCERAIAALGGEAAEDPEVCELLIALGQAHIRAGASERGKDACRRAADLAKALGAPELQARAALAYATELTGDVTVDPEMVSSLRDALAALDDRDSVLRARVLGRLANALMPAPDDEPIRLCRAGLEMARRLGDRETLLFVLGYARGPLYYSVSADERFAMSLETVELAGALGHKVEELGARAAFLTRLVERGNLLQIDAEIDAYARLAAELPARYQWGVPLLRSLRAAIVGRFGEAEELLIEYQTLAERTEGQAARFLIVSHKANLLAIRGDPGSSGIELTEASPLFRLPHSGFVWKVWILDMLGYESEARRVWREQPWSEIRARHLTGTVLVPVVTRLADACVRLGDQELAPDLYRCLLPCDGYNIAFGIRSVIYYGPVGRQLGGLARLVGKLDAASRHFEEALRFCEKTGARPYLAHTALAYAELLGCRQNASDSARARELLEQALAIATELDMRSVAAKAKERLTALSPMPEPRVPVPERRPPAAPITLQREGDIWKLQAGEAIVRLKDAKGLQYLDLLMRHPNEELHVRQIVAEVDPPQGGGTSSLDPGMHLDDGDAGPILDPQAKEAYRRRIQDLREEVEEATEWGDPERSRRAEAEIEAIAEQLSAAVGLRGRDRRAASSTERARINVQRRLRVVLDRIEAHDKALARYLEATVRTGTYCSYTPPSVPFTTARS
jgi:hypothetical protein